MLGSGAPADEIIDPALTSACIIVRAEVDYPADVPTPDPWPATWDQAALELTVDLLRRPSAPFGFFGADLTMASIGPDVAFRVHSLLNRDVKQWGIA